ncbi:MAG TPA: glycosyltransferase family 2 protein [Bryobacteraceae bacterium]|nr:glycosyltransferase family 2 protein [Bryobacteraceae bacterium]
MTVAAVIPHWNRVDLLRALIANLKGQIRPFERIIVVDNGSIDGSAAEGRRLGAEVVALPRNVGFAGAVNRGIEAAAGSDWVAVLNNDVTLEPDWLERLLKAADRPGICFATGKILSAQDHSRIDGCFDEVSRGATAWRCGAGRPDGPVWNRPREIRIAPMTAALFRRSLFEEIGLLDEQFVSYLEDVEFGLRCAVAGRGGVYVPEAVAYHEGSATLGRWNKDTVRLLARNQVLLAAKHFQRLPRWPLVAGQLLWGLVAIRHGRALSYLRGKAQGLRLARQVHEQKSCNAACNTDDPRSIARLTEIVAESERTIFELQRETGFDGYWRAYFWLSRR